MGGGRHAFGRQLPELGEGGVGQAQAPVRAEHRHALAQRIQRLALGARERVEARFEREPLGGVVVKVGDAALRVRAGDDVHGAPVRQVPPVVGGAQAGIGGLDLALPGAEIAQLRQAPLGAEPVEDLPIRRAPLQEGLVERPEVLVAGIPVDQALAAIEDGDGGLEPVERAHMRVHLPLQIGPDRLELAHVGGDAGEAAGGRGLEDVERAALAGDDHRCPRREGGAGPAGLRGALARLAVEQFGAVARGALGVAGLDGACIGGVGPAQAALGIAQPDRLRQGGEQAAQGGLAGGGAGELLAQPQHLAALAGDLAQAQHGAAGDGAALGLDELPGPAADGEGEGLARLLQRLDGGLDALGLGRGSPVAEGERALRPRGAEKAAVALEQRLGARAGPAHDHLRLGGDDRPEPLLLPLGRLEPGGHVQFAPVPARPLAHVEHGGGGGEDDEADDDDRDAARAQIDGGEPARGHLRQGGQGQRASGESRDEGLRAGAAASSVRLRLFRSSVHHASCRSCLVRNPLAPPFPHGEYAEHHKQPGRATSRAVRRHPGAESTPL
jgi:hypothetical protein